MTPVRNEAWILRAFLKATSCWADYIIIADQMSTDGSREIAKEFPKVVLIDNDNREMHQAATRQLLFKEVQNVILKSKFSSSDFILFALDADEFLCGDFIHTEGWNRILSSKPGECFFWRWMNLQPDCQTYTISNAYYWAVHMDETLWSGMFPDNFIHEWRLPWPKECTNSIVIEDLCSLHFARVNVKRQCNKVRFYEMSTMTKKINESGVRMYRMYHEKERGLEEKIIPKDAYIFYERLGIDIIALVNKEDEGEYYLQECRRMINENGCSLYKKLDIWSEDFCEITGVQNPQTLIDRMMHCYLRITNPIHKNIIIRIIDKVLKKIY